MSDATNLTCETDTWARHPHTVSTQPSQAVKLDLGVFRQPVSTHAIACSQPKYQTDFRLLTQLYMALPMQDEWSRQTKHTLSFLHHYSSSASLLPLPSDRILFLFPFPLPLPFPVISLNTGTSSPASPWL